MSARGSVLVVDDEPAMCDLLQEGLARRGFTVRAVQHASAALDLLRSDEYDALLTDMHMPGTSGIALCVEAKAIRPGLPVIVITAFGNMEAAVSAIRSGAYDFITKPVEIEAIALALDRAVDYGRLRSDLRRLQRQVRGQGRADGLIGESPAMSRVHELMARVSDSEVNVLVSGERGTGKELVARALHAASPRARGPFVVFQCAVLAEAMLDRELFGDAAAGLPGDCARSSALCAATGGTLFLDEVADLPLPLQAKLVRTLQTLEPYAVRMMAASHHDLPAAVEEGRFRQDLYFGLNVLELAVPPLRARGNDVLALAQVYLERFASAAGKPVHTLSAEAARRLLAYDWPGNVRELQNCIERAVALARFDQITVDDLPDGVRDYKTSHVLVLADNASELVTLEEVEHRYIVRVLQTTQGNRTAAARILGMDRKTLQRKLTRWQREGDEAIE
jgi:DNA-binding NtrC family response regulator